MCWRDIDAKIRKHEASAEHLGALETRVTELQTLHGDLLARSGEISARHDQIVRTDRTCWDRLNGLRDEAQQTVTRFEGDAVRLAQTVEHMTERVGRLEQAQPAFDAALRDFASLRGTHQEVKDALERMRLAEGEIARVREAQAGTKTWLGDVTESVTALRGELAAVEEIRPTVESVRHDADRLSQAMAQIASRRQLVTQLNTRLSDLTATAAQLDERTGGLTARMDTADRQSRRSRPSHRGGAHREVGADRDRDGGGGRAPYDADGRRRQGARGPPPSASKGSRRKPGRWGGSSSCGGQRSIRYRAPRAGRSCVRRRRPSPSNWSSAPVRSTERSPAPPTAPPRSHDAR